ncbi:MAG: hypothetical protein WDO56_29820 [Gammaproteobacteria bacterium]
MSRQLFARAAGLGALIIGLSFNSTAAPAAEPGASPACDRACLTQTLDAYLSAVFKHDPGSAPLSANHFATSNTAEVRNGEGFWKSYTGYGEVQNRWLDTHNESAAFFGLVKKDGDDDVVSVRIKVEGGKVSEAEWLVASLPNDGKAGVLGPDPAALIKHAPPSKALAPSDRSSRFMLISIANDYFQSVQDHDGSWIPADPGCKDKNSVASNAPRRADICHDNFGIFKGVTKDLALRRFPVVDEEAGVVLGVAIFQRYPGVARQDNLVHEYFLVRRDLIEDIWTSPYYLPKGSTVTSGWENR